MSTPNENNHSSSGHTVARFITPADKARGVTADAIAAELATQAAGGGVAAYDPQGIGSRGVKVQYIKGGPGHQQSGPVETTQRAEVRNVRVQGVQAIALAKEQGGFMRLGDAVELVSVTELAAMFDKLSESPAAQDALVSTVSVELDVLGRVVSTARSLPSPFPSGAEGQAAEVMPSDAAGVQAGGQLGPTARAFAQPGGPRAHVSRRNEVQHVNTKGRIMTVGSTPGSSVGVRVYGEVNVVASRARAIAKVATVVANELQELVADAEAVAANAPAPEPLTAAQLLSDNAPETSEASDDMLDHYKQVLELAEAENTSLRHALAEQSDKLAELAARVEALQPPVPVTTDTTEPERVD